MGNVFAFCFLLFWKARQAKFLQFCADLSHSTIGWQKSGGPAAYIAHSAPLRTQKCQHLLPTAALVSYTCWPSRVSYQGHPRSTVILEWPSGSLQGEGTRKGIRGRRKEVCASIVSRITRYCNFEEDVRVSISLTTASELNQKPFEVL